MSARRASPAAALAAAAILAGCGAPAGDLLAIEIRGGASGGGHRLVVTDDGRARCDERELRAIEGEDLIEAREIERDLGELADDGRSFPAGPPGRRSYVGRVRAGVVRWSEGVRALPPVLPRAQLLALRLERTLCRTDG